MAARKKNIPADLPAKPRKRTSKPRPARKSDNSQSITKNSAIRLIGARQHNLKNLSFDLPLGEFTVVTGPSGSGKSTLAFDTLYAEGQRRYAETFSPYTRQFLERMDKPQVDSIQGIPPAIALSQANSIRTTRSTVGTMTEIADYLKLLMARKARLISPDTGREIRPWKPEELTRHLLSTPDFANRKLLFGFELNFGTLSSWGSIVATLNKQGVTRMLRGNELLRLDPAHPPKKFKGPLYAVLTRLRAEPATRSRIAEAIDSCFRLGGGKLFVTLHPAGKQEPDLLHFHNRWQCPDTGKTFSPPSPALFTFNNPVGACPTCRGFGRVITIDYHRALPDRNLSIGEGVVKPFQTESNAVCQEELEAACRRKKIPLTKPFHQLTRKQQDFVLFGEGKGDWSKGQWYGVKGFFNWLESKTYKVHVRVLLARYRAYHPCQDCGGSRFQPEVNHWQLAGHSLPEINRLSLLTLQELFAVLEPDDNSESTLISQLRSRLHYLNQVGLGYLTLDRTARTLSGGEIQRVNLTTCLGASLVGTLFVLDEPSIGLHPRDTGQLIQTLRKLTDRGNTTLVVEHDDQFMNAADRILELGPGRGEQGGDLVFLGPVTNLKKMKDSLTGNYLSGKKTIPVPEKRRPISPSHPHLNFKNARKNNLQGIDVSIPLQRFTAITGVSGSGKTTLLRDIVHKHLEKHLNHPVEDEGRIDSLTGADSVTDVQIVDQSPLSKTPRSTPLVYLGCYDAVRNLFARTEESLRRGLRASSFSFNSGDGRCTRCQGIGFEKVSMQFLSDLFVSCPVCEGKRFQKHVLDVRWRGHSIHQILETTVTQALQIFDPDQHSLDASERKDCREICQGIQMLADVGLGYLRLGQPLTQLSGGESQRIKLIAQLAKAKTTKQKAVTRHQPSTTGPREPAKPVASRQPDADSILILDEPTTGLHFDDIAVLLQVLQRIVDTGTTLLVIEHNTDLIKCADHIIDLGPEAGDGGGQIVATGTPEAVASVGESHTGRYLKHLLAHPGNKKLKSKLQTPKIKSSKPNDQQSTIRVLGARHHNLKNINVEFPRDAMIVLTGLSGSGKSTLAFDLLFSEGQRRYLDCLNTYARQFIEQLEKPDVDAITGLPPTVAIEQRTSRGGAKSTVATVTEIYHFLRLLYAKIGLQHDPETAEPARRQSADEIIEQVRSVLIKEKELALLAPLVRNRKGIYTELGRWAVRKQLPFLRVDGRWIEPANFQPLDRYREHAIDAVLGTVTRKSEKVPVLVNQALEIGKGTLYTVDNHSRQTIYSTELFCPGSGRSFDALDPRLFSFNSPYGWCPTCHGYGTTAKVSIDPRLTGAEREAAFEAAREETDELMTCPDCHGARLNPVACAVQLGGRPIPQWNALPVNEFARAFKKIKLSPRQQEIARDILPEISQRLHFLEHVGLGYLGLDRSAPTLSGGESQRIRLASQLGSNLQGVLYILDEPSIGLHPRDNQDLLQILQALKNRGNSLVVVEHDEDTMKQADQIIDLGPGAGIHGGEVVAQGHWREISNPRAKDNKQPSRSQTTLLLGEPLQHPLRGQWRPVPRSHPCIEIQGACANNLKNIDVRLPRQRLIALSGISGSGKSTLMHDVIRPAVDSCMKKKRPATQVPKRTGDGPWRSIHCQPFDRILEITQAPIGKTSRSTVATYIGLMDHLRLLFSCLPLAKARGFDKSYFSYNAGKGRCPACQGQGTIKVEMNFLPPTYIPCEQCRGRRWSDSVLEVKYREYSIFDILELSVDEALSLFENQPKVSVPLNLLQETGLGYLKVGQTSPTLSGGEAQRLKLVAELAQAEQIRQKHLLKSTNPNLPENLYLLEEPTVGLHLADVKKLIALLHRLVDSGHTVVVIEHHLDVLAEADWILDIGPEGGAAGGQLIASGPPEKLARSKRSHTAPFLHQLLHPAKAC